MRKIASPCKTEKLPVTSVIPHSLRNTPGPKGIKSLRTKPSYHREPVWPTICSTHIILPILTVFWKACHWTPQIARLRGTIAELVGVDIKRNWNTIKRNKTPWIKHLISSHRHYEIEPCQWMMGEETGTTASKCLCCHESNAKAMSFSQ